MKTYISFSLSGEYLKKYDDGNSFLRISIRAGESEGSILAWELAIAFDIIGFVNYINSRNFVFI